MEGLIFGILRYLNCKLYISLNKYIVVVVVVVVVHSVKTFSAILLPGLPKV